MNLRKQIAYFKRHRGHFLGVSFFFVILLFGVFYTDFVPSDLEGNFVGYHQSNRIVEFREPNRVHITASRFTNYHHRWSATHNRDVYEFYYSPTDRPYVSLNPLNSISGIDIVFGPDLANYSTLKSSEYQTRPYTLTSQGVRRYYYHRILYIGSFTSRYPSGSGDWLDIGHLNHETLEWELSSGDYNFILRFVPISVELPPIASLNFISPQPIQHRFDIAAGGNAPYTYSLSSGVNLPEGLSLASDGELTGTVFTDGTYNDLRIDVEDGFGYVETSNIFSVGFAGYELTYAASLIDPELRFYGTGLASQSYDLSQYVTGGVEPYTFSLIPGEGDIPLGLTFNSTGELSGVPTAPANWTIAFNVIDANGVSINLPPVRVIVDDLVTVSASDLQLRSVNEDHFLTIPDSEVLNLISFSSFGVYNPELASVQAASHGLVELLVVDSTISPPRKSIQYTPFLDWHGHDSFEFTVNTTIGPVSARVPVNVRSVNDPPVFEISSSDTHNVVLGTSSAQIRFPSKGYFAPLVLNVLSSGAPNESELVHFSFSDSSGKNLNLISEIGNYFLADVVLKNGDYELRIVPRSGLKRLEYGMSDTFYIVAVDSLEAVSPVVEVSVFYE
jgi:hypothetical protein